MASNPVLDPLAFGQRLERLNGDGMRLRTLNIKTENLYTFEGQNGFVGSQSD